MKQYILENYMVVKNKVLEYNFGVMVEIIKEIGNKINLMDLVDMYMKMVKHTKVIGRINMQKVKVNFINQKVVFQKDNGKMIFNMEKVKKHGLMVLIIKVNIKMV